MNKYQNKNNGESYWKWKNPNLTESESIDKETNWVSSKLYNLLPFNINKWGEHPNILKSSKSVKFFKVDKQDNGLFKINAPLK